MAQRSWDNLSPDYRKRLQNAGITKGQYESGVSLAKARGHEETPERPERADTAKGKERYKKYQADRTRIIDKIRQFKKDHFKAGSKWNESRSDRNVRNDPETGKPRGIKDLRRIEQQIDIAVDEDTTSWDELIDMSDEYESAFFYH